MKNWLDTYNIPKAQKGKNIEYDWESIRKKTPGFLENFIESDYQKEQNKTFYDHALEDVLERKGGTKEQWDGLKNTIAYHESKGDPAAIQGGGGPGRGLYQFEPNSLKTAAVRAINYAKNNKREVPDYINKIAKGKITDATKLTQNQQDELLLLDYDQKANADLGKYFSGKQSAEDFWIEGHWGGEKSKGKKVTQKRRNSFKRDFEEYNKSKNADVKLQQGGAIQDNRGQWEHPGEITQIQGDERGTPITMENVRKPLIAISNNGEMKLLNPQEKHHFKGDTVTEYPLAQDGTQINNNWLNSYEIPKAQDGLNSENYLIKKGDTLSKISHRTGMSVQELVKINNIENPDLIYAGENLKIPYKYEGLQPLKKIPQEHHKNIVIDNYSPNYDYLVQGDKFYYSKKNNNQWADISDNDNAKKNIFNFLDKKYELKGYSNYEKSIKDSMSNNSYNYKDFYDKRYSSNKKETPYTLPKLPSNEPELDYNEVFDLNKDTPDYKPIDVLQDLSNKNDITKSEIKNISNYTNTLEPINENNNWLDDLTDWGEGVVDSVTDTFSEVSDSVENVIKDVSDTISGSEDVGSFFEKVSNGINRKIQLKTGDTDDIEVPTEEKMIENLNPKTVAEYYKDRTNKGIVSAVLDAPKTDGRIYKQQMLPSENISFGIRNRGDVSKTIETDGLEITTFNPFTEKSFPDKTTVIAIDPEGNLHAGIAEDFKNKTGWMFSNTTRNNIIEFPSVDGKSKFKPSVKNKGYNQPVTKVKKDDGSIIEGSLSMLINKKNNENFYGNVQGGRILVQDPSTKQTYLLSGSFNHIKQQFNKLKNNNEYLTVYNLDNGTYSRGLSYKDKKLTPDRLKKYDNENSNGGGNGLYIKNYNAPVNYYEEDFINNMPNVRTTQDESYKKGHALKNKIKNIVLHHTAFTDEIKNEQQVKDQFMSPNNASAHIVIEEDGKRNIYASPEQVTFHAGKSYWGDSDNVNDFSVGVEFQGDTNKKPLTEAQIKSFIEYYDELALKHNLDLESIITHQMIRDSYIEKNPNDKNVHSKPDITKKEYQRILNYIKKRN